MHNVKAIGLYSRDLHESKMTLFEMDIRKTLQK